MTNTMYNHSLHTSQRSESAIQAHRGDVPSKHDEYLVQLQERNRLIKAYQNQRQPKVNNLKQRETGFQLYLNGAHSAPKRRPASILNGTSNRTVTPSPYFADFSFPTPSNTTQQTNVLPSNGRRRWAPSTKTKIKTADGSIIADIDQTPLPNSNPPPLPHSKSLFNHPQSDPLTSKRAVKSAGTPSDALPKSAWGEQVIELDASQIKAAGFNDQISFCQMKPKNLDQSWMPNWFSKPKSNPDPDYESDFEEDASSSDDDDNNQQLLNRVSLSCDDIPSFVKLSITHDEENKMSSLSPTVDSYVAKRKAA